MTKLFYCNQDQYNESQDLLDKTKQGLDLSQFVNQKPQAYIHEGIGHVFVSGMLLSNAAPIDKQLGGTDYKDIINELNSCVEQGCKGVILHVNSGGGQVLGCIEAAEAIQTLPIPVVGMVEGMACSAAYKLVSGSTYIVSNKSAISGNIGTIMVHMDNSEMLKSFGITVNVFTNDGATLKSIGRETLSDEQIEFLQAGINQAGKAFQDHVLANRPNLNTEVFNAGWYSGNKALELGLVDELGNDKLALQRLMEIIEVVTPVI